VNWWLLTVTVCGKLLSASYYIAINVELNWMYMLINYTAVDNSYCRERWTVYTNMCCNVFFALSDNITRLVLICVVMSCLLSQTASQDSFLPPACRATPLLGVPELRYRRHSTPHQPTTNLGHSPLYEDGSVISESFRSPQQSDDSSRSSIPRNSPMRSMYVFIPKLQYLLCGIQTVNKCLTQLSQAINF